MTPRDPQITARRSITWRRDRALGGQAGHTVLELMSVVAILLILLGSAVPSFSQMLSIYALQGASRQVFADLQRARMAAVSENNRYVIRFIDSHTYTVHDDSNSNGTIDAGETVTTVDLQKDWPAITVGATADTLTFLSDATVLAADTATVTSASGKTRTITVNVAGYVRVS
jgi:Tfp pilus assembly protein FimT